MTIFIEIFRSLCISFFDRYRKANAIDFSRATYRSNANKWSGRAYLWNLSDFRAAFEFIRVCTNMHEHARSEPSVRRRVVRWLRRVASSLPPLCNARATSLQVDRIAFFFRIPKRDVTWQTMTRKTNQNERHVYVDLDRFVFEPSYLSLFPFPGNANVKRARHFPRNYWTMHSQDFCLLKNSTILVAFQESRYDRRRLE